MIYQCKTEKLINSSLHQLKKSEKIYHRLRTTGSKSVRLYGLVKAHKNRTPLRPDLSIHGGSYENLNKVLCPVLGLSFNPKSKNQLKKAQNLLVKGQLSTRNDIVVRHDLIKNSISSQKLNNYRQSSVQELKNYLTSNNKCFQRWYNASALEPLIH